MNGYGSENSAFSFCKRTALIEKNGSMLPGKFMWQNQFTATQPKPPLQADLQQLDEKL
jgi:hypothetical protein